MMEDPHRLIEGLIIAAWALGSRAAYIYCRGEFLPCIESINKALNQAYAAGYLGENIMGTKFCFDIFVHRGAGAYICGEETALINSLEGQKGQPRLKPPFPAVSGAWKSPTCVNNVETIMALPWILQHDPSEYAKMGTPRAGGTKVFCISGDVKNPGVYEAPLGTPMMTMINDYAGGVVGGKLKAVLPGGSSCAPLTAEEAAVATMDYECLASMKTMFGSGAMIIINDTHNMVDLLNCLGNFYSHESCGQCTPCREGTGLLHRILNLIVDGKGHDGDVELMQSLCGGFGGVTICPLSISLGGPVGSYTAKFRADFDEYIAKNPDHAKPRVQETYRPGIFW
jgi:NADH-quinone oxidoreductase subunit F